MASIESCATTRWSAPIWPEAEAATVPKRIAPLSVAAGNVTAGLVMAWALARAVGPGRRALTLPPRSVLLALGALLLTHLLATVFAPGPARWDKLVEEMCFKLLLVAIPVVAAGRSEVARRAIWLTLAAGTAAAIYDSSLI